MAHRVARLCALLACAAAVTYSLYFLFGPTYTTCSIGPTPISPGQTPGPIAGPMSCHSATFFEANAGGPLGASQLIRPLTFITLWAIAPFIALAGVALRSRGQVAGVGLVAIAFLVDASSIISMGGGFVFALLCGPLLLTALIATIAIRRLP